MALHSRNLTTKPLRHQKRSGFTLVEILVVLGLISFISALVVGSFNSVSAGNKRLTCQTNLVQLYQSIRLYAADANAFPYFDPDDACNRGKSIGLWAVHAYPDNTNPNLIAPLEAPIGSPREKRPTDRYLRNTKILHCPQDLTPGHEFLTQETGSGATLTVEYNRDYLSYQTVDPTTSQQTYQSIRTLDNSSGNRELWLRQLAFYDGTMSSGGVCGVNNTPSLGRTPADSTVITWCPWHRKENFGRGYDNVLFYDGTVQQLPPVQERNGSNYDGWKRWPRPAF